MLETLKIFVDLVDLESFSRAAEKNFVSQSAVSQRIRHFEEEVGHRLVVRGRGRLALTEAGDVVYRAGQEILDRYARARDQLDRMSGIIAGEVRLGTVPSIGLHELPPYVTDFLRRYPDADLQLEYLRAAEIRRRVLDGSLDLGIVAYAARHSRLTALPFLHDELIVIVPPDHRLGARRRITVRDLAGESFVAIEPGIPTGRAIQRMLQRADVSVRVVHTFDNIETIKRAVEIGIGLSVVPGRTAKQEIEAGSLRGLAIRDKGWERPLSILHRRGLELNPAMQSFLEVLGQDLPG